MGRTLPGEGPGRLPAPGGTRRRVLGAVLRRGPVTAAELAGPLGLGTAGVRRHLDRLLAEGMIRVDRGGSGGAGSAARPPRGRPARRHVITPRGRAAFGHGYDDLAELALERLVAVAGPEALRGLARERARRIAATVPAAAAGDRTAIAATARALAEAFDAHGHMADVSADRGTIRICRHHCPVSHVAATHPEFCEAEHEMIAELTGVEVASPTSIAGGDLLCATDIPLAPHLNTPDERSGYDPGDRKA